MARRRFGLGSGIRNARGAAANANSATANLRILSVKANELFDLLVDGKISLGIEAKVTCKDGVPVINAEIGIIDEENKL